MTSPEYVKKIKALITAKEETELELKRALYAFRNGRKVEPETIAAAEKSFAEVLAILKEGSTDNG